MFRNIFVVVTILITLAFFELKIVPPEFMTKIQFALIPVLVALFFLLYVYDNSKKITSNFSKEIYMIWLAVGLSMLGAFYFHNQPYGITAIAQRAMYFYIFYFLLLKLKCKPLFLIKATLVLGGILILLYLVQTVLYPNKILYSSILKDRGTLRISIPGIGYLVIAYFYAFDRLMNNMHYKYALICLISLIIFILLGSRQLLGSMLLITILNLILSKKITSKFLIFFFAALAVIPIFIIFKDILLEILEVTKTQGGSFKYDIRVQAAKFFIMKFFPNSLSYIIGNGASGGQSSYNIMVDYFSKTFGFYQSDIGIIGEYSKFGILFVIANIIILIKIIIIKLPEDYKFLKYVNLINVLTMFTGDVMSVMHGIVLMSILFYLIDISKYQPRLHEY